MTQSIKDIQNAMFEKWAYRILLGICTFFCSQFYFDNKKQTQDIEQLKLSSTRIETELRAMKDAFIEFKSDTKEKLSKN
jgi:hypothetical protein